MIPKYISDKRRMTRFISDRHYVYTHLFPNGKFFREEYCLIKSNGNVVLHRDDGPAQSFWFETGELQSECHLVNGNTHRLDGPARTFYLFGEYKHEYFINGERVFASSLDEFKKIVKLLIFK